MCRNYEQKGVDITTVPKIISRFSSCFLTSALHMVWLHLQLDYVTVVLPTIATGSYSTPGKNCNWIILQ